MCKPGQRIEEVFQAERDRCYATREWGENSEAAQFARKKKRIVVERFQRDFKSSINILFNIHDNGKIKQNTTTS